MKIYTKTGDDGTTSLVGGKRISKSAPRLDAYGTIDELSSHIGMSQSLLAQIENSGENCKNLQWIQQKLFSIGGALATDTLACNIPASCLLTVADVEHLEYLIDRLDETLPKQHCFILPGGGVAASALHVARTVCRRAERLVIGLEHYFEVPQYVIPFLNRLSDYLFLMARKANQLQGNEEILWQ